VRLHCQFEFPDVFDLTPEDVGVADGQSVLLRDEALTREVASDQRPVFVFAEGMMTVVTATVLEKDIEGGKIVGVADGTDRHAARPYRAIRRRALFCPP
jgi:hypothetical protein